MKASHDALSELFERIDSLFDRLRLYTEASLTAGMKKVFVKIMVEVLSILSIATDEMKRNRARELFPHDILHA